MIASAVLLLSALTLAQPALAQQDRSSINRPDRPDHPIAIEIARASLSQPTGPSASMREMLDAQNVYRSRVGNAELVWTPDLANEADQLVEKIADGTCSAWTANKVTTDQHASFYWAPAVRGIGGSSTSQDLSARFVASEWDGGGIDYSHADGVCLRDTRTCSAYAYMIEPTSRRLGCAFTVCSNNAQVWVCRYEGKRIAEVAAESPPGSDPS